MSHRVSKGDCADLGFAWSSLLAGAIDADDFRTWAERVVAETPSDDLPPYMIDLMLAEAPRDLTVGLRDITGFWPNDPSLASDDASVALSGIAILRGTHRPDDLRRPPEACLQALRDNSDVATRFAALFPNITLPEPA